MSMFLSETFAVDVDARCIIDVDAFVDVGVEVDVKVDVDAAVDDKDVSDTNASASVRVLNFLKMAPLKPLTWSEQSSLSSS